ncbi:Uncharacterised protein [uncultured Clostridium sp.]|uniref:hypothetical protein n=1 Tax=uncultured Clostridium sp. TaxID=59620 RepID=UPI000820DCE3|nr:hypothetical protein [uncultured Clostridium sp.]SCJ91774.1 Uncharacterised protein [uncultured Clostridium sp.]
MEELLQHDLEEAHYYLNIPNLIIVLPIIEIATSEDGVTLTLGEDNKSSITIWKEASEVKRVRRPTGIIGEFEWCYLIKNEYKESIGYIGR